VPVKNTVEQPMLQIQDGKFNLGQGALRNLTAEEMEKSRISKVKGGVKGGK